MTPSLRRHPSHHLRASPPVGDQADARPKLIHKLAWKKRAVTTPADANTLPHTRATTQWHPRENERKGRRGASTTSMALLACSLVHQCAMPKSSVCFRVKWFIVMVVGHDRWCRRDFLEKRMPPCSKGKDLDLQVPHYKLMEMPQEPSAGAGKLGAVTALSGMCALLRYAPRSSGPKN